MRRCCCITLLGDDWGYQFFVITLIAYLHVSSVALFSYSWFTYPLTPQSIGWLIVFNMGCLMIYYNYYLACTTHPGTALSPLSVMPEEVVFVETQVSLRQCQRCRVMKPPRSHHCSVCKSCILKMDHHCHFVRFLMYVDLTCSLLLATLCQRGLDWMKQVQALQFHSLPSTSLNLDPASVVVLCFNTIVVGLVVMMVGILSVYHLSYLCSNSTTVDSWERARVEATARRLKRGEVPYPYDLGWYRNVCSVLGPRWYLWLWPQPMQGNGKRFEMAKGLTAEQEAWPPLFYLEAKGRHAQWEEYDDDDDEDNDDDDSITPAHTKRPAHVRRGSEGWEVRTLTAADRERMLQQALKAENPTHDLQVPNRQRQRGGGEEGNDTEDEVPLNVLESALRERRPRSRSRSVEATQVTASPNQVRHE